jgi:hypothetical protein
MKTFRMFKILVFLGNSSLGRVGMPIRIVLNSLLVYAFLQRFPFGRAAFCLFFL